MFCVFIKYGQEADLYHDLEENEAREMYRDYADDPKCDQVLVIEGAVIASSTNPTFQELTNF